MTCYRGNTDPLVFVRRFREIHHEFNIFWSMSYLYGIVSLGGGLLMNGLLKSVARQPDIIAEVS